MFSKQTVLNLPLFSVSFDLDFFLYLVEESLHATTSTVIADLFNNKTLLACE